MRLLVLGGTRFIGRAIVQSALDGGHSVTTFNRGRAGRDVPGTEVVIGDRENAADLGRLVSGREWDAVIDTSGYVPAVTGTAARALSDRAGTYVFMSTVSVYPGWPDEPVSEDSPIYDGAPDVQGTADDASSWPAAHYGRYKAGCERAVTAAFKGRVPIMRPGVILGPGENVGRLTWWLARIAEGGQVLAPGDSQHEIQPVDVRDVAEFALLLLDSDVRGPLNVTAPVGHETFGGMLSACADTTGSDAQFVWVEDGFLMDNGVRQWTEIPLWRIPLGTWRVESGRAEACGLNCRPLATTVADTWSWLSGGHKPTADSRQSEHGLDRAKETHLLEMWQQRSGRSGKN